MSNPQSILQFGYLDYRHVLELDGGSIRPIEGREKASAWVKANVNRDGFVYPPLSHQVKLDLVGGEPLEKVPNTEQPADLHQLPASHELQLSDSKDHSRSNSAFLMHSLGYMFGVRLQFSDWWFDGRVRVKLDEVGSFGQEVLRDFVSHAYRTWRTWPQEQQRLITNLLYMHCRSSMYQWEWERFAIDYMVFDGCYKLGRLTHSLPEIGHAKRIAGICERFDIPLETTIVGKIVALRNDLFHETLWDKSQPCSGGSSFAYQVAAHLRRLNERLFPALLGYRASFIKTAWWSYSTVAFSDLQRGKPGESNATGVVSA